MALSMKQLKAKLPTQRELMSTITPYAKDKSTRRENGRVADFWYLARFEPAADNKWSVCVMSEGVMVGYAARRNKQGAIAAAAQDAIRSQTRIRTRFTPHFSER